MRSMLEEDKWLCLDNAIAVSALFYENLPYSDAKACIRV
jgi:hypothetical protein